MNLTLSVGFCLNLGVKMISSSSYGRAAKSFEAAKHTDQPLINPLLLLLLLLQFSAAAAAEAATAEKDVLHRFRSLCLPCSNRIIRISSSTKTKWRLGFTIRVSAPVFSTPASPPLRRLFIPLRVPSLWHHHLALRTISRRRDPPVRFSPREGQRTL